MWLESVCCSPVPNTHPSILESSPNFRCRLQVRDIDSERKLIHFRAGKCGSDPSRSPGARSPLFTAGYVRESTTTLSEKVQASRRAVSTQASLSSDLYGRIRPHAMSPMDTPMGDITHLLHEWRAGSREAENQLFHSGSPQLAKTGSLSDAAGAQGPLAAGHRAGGPDLFPHGSGQGPGLAESEAFLRYSG